MSFLSALKSIVHFDASKIKTLIEVRISKLINVDRSIHIEGSPNAAVLIIDPDKLDNKQKAALKKAIREEGLPEAGVILEAQSEIKVDEIRKALPSHEDIARKLGPIIPASDKPLMYACLLLRRRSEAGESVEGVKLDICKAFGNRGRNFANLCSAGYLESWAYPLYEDLLKTNPGQPELAKAKFQQYYNETLLDLPWTEFVSARQTADEARDHIISKMKRNKANGIRYMNIHAFGAGNVRKIQAIVPAINREMGASVSKVEMEITRIFVRLEIRPALE
jgi:hypothetical protein